VQLAPLPVGPPLLLPPPSAPEPIVPPLEEEPVPKLPPSWLPEGLFPFVELLPQASEIKVAIATANHGRNQTRIVASPARDFKHLI
jgi:hypothetical protein